MNKTWLSKRLLGERVTGTCCVAVVGADVLIEPQTVWFFRPEVSFKQPREINKCI